MIWKLSPSAVQKDTNKELGKLYSDVWSNVAELDARQEEEAEEE